MKSGWLILAVAALLGITAFSFRLAISRSAECGCAASARSADAREALAWMKSELHLDDAEFDKVCALHEAYLPKCDAMCGRIEEAGARLSGALCHSGSLTTEVQAALSDYDAQRAECLRATLEHLTQTASVMKPEARRAFLEKVLPHLLASHQHVSEVTR